MSTRRSQKITILLADDSDTVRSALEEVMHAEADLQVVASARNAEEAIALAATTLPDIALVDVQMPLGGGVAATRGILQGSSSTKVIALSASRDDRAVLNMLDAGAIGYLVKGGSVDEILTSVRAGASDQYMLSTEVARTVIDELVGRRNEQRREEENLQSQRQQIEDAMASESALEILGQPLCRLDSGEIVGEEALSRFHLTPSRPPNEWFAIAEEVGLGLELEIHAAKLAMKWLHHLSREQFIAINLSPDSITSRKFLKLLDGIDPLRIVAEVTEHARIQDYDDFNSRISELRSLGVRLSIDDAGAGFASMRHIMRLQPDIIKLDLSLISGIDSDKGQQVLVKSLAGYAADLGASMVAEGVETESEREMLSSLGVAFGQGYLLGRPHGMR